MSTTNALDDGFDEAERGLEWLEKLEALQARSASDQAALEVAEYVMKLRSAVIALAGNLASEELKKPQEWKRRNWWKSCDRKATMTAGTAASVQHC
jgi:hypothetical protein